MGETEEKSWKPRVQRGVMLFLLFVGGALMGAAVRGCFTGSAAGDSPSVQLERISGELDDVQEQLREAGDGAFRLTDELQSAVTEVGAIRGDGTKLEREIGDVRDAATAIGEGIGRIEAADTSIRGAINDIERFIEETNRANRPP
jgi:chromosome segregation ATPase